jgi:hypothetical protein
MARQLIKFKNFANLLSLALKGYNTPAQDGILCSYEYVVEI